jgi:prevent-host-death family protein
MVFLLKNGEEKPMNQIEVMTISKFKATCLSVLDKVKKTGKPVMITRHGKPIAVIDPPPVPKKKKSWIGSFKSKGKITGDILTPVIDDDDWHVLQ